MRKRIFLVFFLSFVSLINASFLIDVYHKDYGYIVRTVLVFDSKPNYSVLKHQDDIQINILNCRKDATIQNIQIPNSNVLKAFDFLVSKDKVMVVLSINQTLQLISGEPYKVELYELSGELFKLVLDVFAIKNPKTLEEVRCFADFYKTIGKTELADEYYTIASELKTVQPTQTVTDSIVKTREPKNFFKKTLQSLTFIESLKNTLNIKVVIILAAGIVFVIILIVIISKVTKKKVPKSDF
ncbi:MAG: hypothetical protein H8E11_00490, partial [Candidatus Cloacimonetes bacterium]|nr:hypothetical protein [Candidatus Cloacimonadota bacterium]